VGHADFKLEALVDFVLLELGQLGVEAIDFGRKIGLDAVDLCVELVDPAIESRFDCGEIVLGRHVLDDMRKHASKCVERSPLCCHMGEVYHADRSAHAGVGFGLTGEAVGRRIRKIDAGGRRCICKKGRRQICKVVGVPELGVERWIGCWFCRAPAWKERVGDPSHQRQAFGTELVQQLPEGLFSCPTGRRHGLEIHRRLLYRV
jgi:hypothetical protein